MWKTFLGCWKLTRKLRHWGRRSHHRLFFHVDNALEKRLRRNVKLLTKVGKMWKLGAESRHRRRKQPPPPGLPGGQWGRLCTARVDLRLFWQSLPDSPVRGMKERRTSATGGPACISDVVIGGSFDGSPKFRSTGPGPSTKPVETKSFVPRATGKMLKWLRKNFTRRHQVSVYVSHRGARCEPYTF